MDFVGRVPRLAAPPTPAIRPPSVERKAPEEAAELSRLGYRSGTAASLVFPVVSTYRLTAESFPEQ